MIKTLWNTLEYIQNYSRIMIELIKLIKINDRITFTFRNTTLWKLFKNFKNGIF